MSIALDSSSTNRIDLSGLLHGVSCGSAYDSSESGRPVAGIFGGNRRLTADHTAEGAAAGKNVVEEQDEEADSSSSSSIGRNSDSSGGDFDGDGDSGEGEVQSSYKGPLDALDALEEVLPMKRGISKFYSGKSKSFTSLGEATSCSSIKEIVKPENAFTRKRRNLLAHSTCWEKNRSYPLKGNSGGITKRLGSSNRSCLALAVTMGSYENNSESSNSSSSPPTLCRPPLHPHSRRSPNNESASSSPRHTFSSWRSFSLSDLQCAAAAAAAASSTGLVVSHDGNEDKLQ